MISILDPRFQYVPACRTNIMDRFRAAGFVPPSEQRKRQPDELQRLRLEVNNLQLQNDDLRARLVDARLHQQQNAAEARLRQLRWDLDLLGIFTKDGKLVVMDAEKFEAALARADGCGGAR